MNWGHRVFRRTQQEEQLEKELRFHLEQHAADLMARGCDPAVGVGLAAALVAARLLERLVEGVRSTDPLTFVTMISVLVLAALFASFLPARRASRVDPMRALRQD